MPRKTCKTCGVSKSWCEFRASRKWPDGSMRSPRSYCIPCDNARRAALKRDHLCGAKGHEIRRKAREYNAAYYADPERREIRAAQERERRYGTRGAPRTRKPRVGSSAAVDAGPFLEYVESVRTREGLSVESVAAWFGLPPRTLRRLRDERRAAVDTIDRAPLHAGGATFDDLYPLVAP